jgi:AcrR family transcriptional regulator
MGTGERREREKAATRQKIVDAAREMFAREGYEAVSMRRIADAIEYTPAAIYVHFPDKEALFHEVVGCDFLRLGGEFTRLGQIADPIERIRQIGRAYVQFGVQNPNHYRLMFMTEHEHQLEKPNDPGHSAYAFLESAVQEAMAAGLFRESLSHGGLVAQTLWACVHGVTSLQIVKCKAGLVDFAPLDVRSDTMCECILRGMLRDPSRLKEPS